MQEELVEHGKVLSSVNGVVEVELLSSEKCEECSAKLFCSSNKDSTKILKVNSSYDYKVGENVSIAIAGKNILLATLNLYFYPLLILIFTTLIGITVFAKTNSPELYSFLSSLFLVIIYYVLFFQISKRIKSVEPKIFITENR